MHIFSVTRARTMRRRSLAILVAALIIGVPACIGGALAQADLLGAAKATPFDRPVAMAIDTHTGRAFIVSATRTDLKPPTLGALRVIDASTMAVLRTYPMGAGTVAVDERLQRAVAVDPTTGLMRVLDTRSGDILQTVIVGHETGSTEGAVAVSDRTDRVFILDPSPYPHAGLVRMFDALSGKLLQTIGVGIAPGKVAVDEWTSRVFVLNGANGIRGQTGSVSVLDARTGHVVRTTVVGTLPNDVIFDPRSRRAFIVSGTRTLYVLDARTGRYLRTVTVGAMPAAVAIDPARERAYVINMQSSNMSMLDTRTTWVLRTIRLPEPPSALAIDERTGRVWIGSWDFNAQGAPRGVNHVYVLDGTTGAIVRRITEEGEPAQILVDGRTRRVFVLNGDGYTWTYRTATDRWSWIPASLRRRLPFIPTPSPATSTLRPVSGNISSFATTL